MTDLADLGLRIRSEDVEVANKRLDGLTGASARAETATAAMAREANAAASQVRQMADQIRAVEQAEMAAARAANEYARQTGRTGSATDEMAKSVRAASMTFDDFYQAADRNFATQYVNQMGQIHAAQVRGARVAKLQAHEVTNLGRQFADIGVMLASGQNPLMTILQQGPQVADVFASAKARGVGFKAVLGEIAAMAGPLLPLLLAIAAAAATIGIVGAVGAQQMNKEHKDLIKTLGLTKEQLKRVKEENITMGDVLMGTWDVVAKHAAEALGLKDAKKALAGFYQWAVDTTVNNWRQFVGVVGGAIGAVKALFGVLGPAIADIMVSAANGVIRIVERMVNEIIKRINTVLAMVNAAAAVAKVPIQFKPFGAVDFSELANENAGAAQNAVAAVAKGAKAGRDEAIKGFNTVLQEIEDATLARWKKRVLKEAGEANARKAKAKGDSALERAIADSEAYIQALKDEAATLGMNAIEAKEYEIAQRALLAPTEELRKATEEAGKALTDKMVAEIASTKAANDNLAVLQLETSLIGAGNVQRAVQIAQLIERQRLMAAGGQRAVDEGSKPGGSIELAGDIVRQQAALAIGQEQYNRSLDATLDRLQDIDDLVNNSTAGLADAFDDASTSAGKFIRALGGVLGAVTRLGVTEERINRTRIDSAKRVQDAYDTGDINKWFTATEEHDRTMQKTAREMADAQVGAYASMAGAAKGFFEEGSTGYKVMQAAEIAFRAIQFALSVQAMAQDAKETATHLANAGAKAVASTIAGVAKCFEQLGVWGFVGAAAVLAFMAAIGINAGSGGDKRINAQELQERQGTGSVLGDATAKSESIANSLELVAAHTNTQLEYSNAMLRALRGIEGSITTVAAAIARSLGLGGALDPNNVKTGSQTINHSFLGGGTNKGADPWITFGVLGGLPDFAGFHNTSISKKLVDSGIRFVGQTVGDILAGGIEASFYQTVQTRTQKKAFGFTYSDKIKTKTSTSALDEDLSRQLGLIVSGLRDGVLAAASVLGVQGAGAVLDAFKLNLGNISFKDMKGDEIEAALNAVFSKLGDDMAGAVIPGLKDLQRAGEGLFETLMRVARQYQVIDVTLSSVGMTFGAVGVSSLAARERLVNLFGSLDDFVDQVSFYSENFLTEAERLAPVQAALNAELARLGITGLDTRDEFKALVQSLDVSTQAGAELFAALMAIAPAFAAITEESKAVADQRDRLSTAYERESSALADTKARFQDLAKSLGAFRMSLYSGPSAALSPEAQYLATKAEFERVAGLAAQGNEQALGDLQGVSQEYLDASRAYYASSQGYFADLAAVRQAVTAAEGIAGSQVDVATQQLDALKALVDPILHIEDDIGTVAEELAALNALLGANAPNTPVVVNGVSQPSNDNSDVVAAIEQTNAQLETTNATLRAQIDQQTAMAAENSARLAAVEDELRRIRQQGQDAA